MNVIKNIVFCVFFLITSNLFSQIHDLASLASGDVINFSALYKSDEKLYGYVVVYDYGEISDEQKKFEYVLLDKNLNKVANDEFLADASIYNFKPYFNIKDQLILFPKASYGNKKTVYPESKIIDIENKKVSNYLYECFKDGEIKICDENKSYKDAKKSKKEEFKEKGYIDYNNLMQLSNGYYVAIAFKGYGKFTYGILQIKYVKDFEIKVFDENKKEIWNKSFAKEGSKKAFERVVPIKSKFDQLALVVYKYKKGEIENKEYFVFDVKSGEQLLNEKLENTIDKKTTKDKASKIKDFNDKWVLVGRTLKKDYYKGFYRIKIDKNTQKIEQKVLNFIDLKPFLENINQYGFVESGYSLSARNYFIHKNGAIDILTEKYKYSMGKPKTRDFVLIRTNKDFQVTNVEIIKKDKSKYSTSDFLYSQYLNDQKDFLFFYQDYKKDDVTKDKNWVLGVNSIIDGKFKNQEINISSEDYTIYPFPAKEGYILLREINEKDKYNQIRLEKLNL